MAELSQATKNLLSKYQLWQKSLQPQEGVPLIHIDEVVSKVAIFYEKMRGVIDWREEHLLRRTAIERILKRRLFLKKSGKEVSEPFVNELIRGGHFPNDSIPEAKISEIQKSIDKYVYIDENAPQLSKEKLKLQFRDRLFSIAACEIEEILSAPIREIALMDFMLEKMEERTEVRNHSVISTVMPEDEKRTQLYIAIQKALFKLDTPLISYNLFKKWFPDWLELSQERLIEITNNIHLVWEKLQKSLKHPLAEKFYSVCERYDTAYLILGDVIGADPAEAEAILTRAELLEHKIKSSYKERLKKANGRLKRAAFYSTLSIFLTKVLIALAVEIPFDRYIAGEFDYTTVGMSVLIPPLLMAFLVTSIRPPSKQNEQLVVMEVMKVAYESERKDLYEVKPSRKRGFVFNTIIVLIYLLSFVASFGLIIWGLKELNFGLISIIIFLMFTCLISFAGTKIRQRAQELKVEREKDTLLRSLIDLFSLPIIQVGRWLSTQWEKYNALAVLFNSLLDMPFQVFLEFLEQWRSFLKEKKEKLH